MKLKNRTLYILSPRRYVNAIDGKIVSEDYGKYVWGENPLEVYCEGEVQIYPAFLLIVPNPVVSADRLRHAVWYEYWYVYTRLRIRRFKRFAGDIIEAFRHL